MASLDNPSALSPSSKKRHRNDFDPVLDPMPKRLCHEPQQSNPHLSFLEEFCDFEASLDTSALVSSMQEELVAEMMKSLEKVIGDGDEDSISPKPFCSSQASTEPSSALATPEPSTSALDSAWQYVSEEEGHGGYAEPVGCELDFECGQASDALSGSSSDSDPQIMRLLEASDDELGIPVTSRTLPCEEDVQERENEWALLDQACHDVPLHDHATLSGWLDGSFHQFEDSFPAAREFCEAVMLF